MNPLLNRLYQSKSSSRRKRPASLRDELSIQRDKLLVPKLHKNSINIGTATDLTAQRQKTVILRSNAPKLPALTQKQLNTPSSKKRLFRQRKISFKQQPSQSLYFPTELAFNIPQPAANTAATHNANTEERKYKAVTQLDENHQETEQQLFEYLKIIEKNQELKEQFCYMNRGENPYSYYIVEYENLNKQQFLTVSLRGVSIYKDEESPQFTTVDKLAHEIEIYRKVKKIEFFEKYVIEKVMRHWKYRTVRRKFEAQCRIISRILFSQNIINQNYFNFLAEINDNFAKCKFLDLRVNLTSSIEHLRNLLKNKQLKIEKQLDYFQSKISAKLKEAIQKNLLKFRQQQRVTLALGTPSNVPPQQSPQSPQSPQQQSFLPFDSKKKAMKYTQMAKLKQFQSTMYRLLKLTDLVRFNTKISMITDGMMNFNYQIENLHQKYLNRKQATFVSWLQIKTSLEVMKTGEGMIKCEPSIDKIRKLIIEHLRSILEKIYKKHFLLIERKDEYYCEEYSPQADEMPNRLDLKYYIENGQEPYHTLRIEGQQKLQICLNDIAQYIEQCQSKLCKIYNESNLNHNIDYYMENEQLKQYLQSQIGNRKVISEWEPIVEFGIANIDITDVLLSVKNRFEEKYKQITSSIPNEVLKRCEILAKNITNIYNIFKENPSTVMEYINFNRNFHQEKKKINDLQQKIQAILELEEMVYKNGLRIGEHAKIHISQCSTYFRELCKRLQEIQSNEEKDRKKFEKIVDDMVEPLDNRAEELYVKIYEDEIIGESSVEPKKCLQKLSAFQEQFLKLKARKQQLFYYQDELSLGHKDIPNYFKTEACLFWLMKLWRGRQQYSKYEQLIKVRGYSEIADLDVTQLQVFLRDIESASSQLQQVELMQNFKHDTLNIIKIIQVCKLISSKTLQQEHHRTIKEKLVTENKKIRDYIFLKEGGRVIICEQLIKQSNILEIKDELEEVVFTSAQESIIKQNLRDIQEFWKKNKITLVLEDLAKNGVEIMHFGKAENEKLQQKIGSFLLTLKNIQGSQHSIGELNEKVVNQINICQYLKATIQKWIQVEKQWIKLLPLMTNCPSVKHQSNVYFEFTSVDNNLRKISRQVNDHASLRKLVEDQKDEKYYNLLLNCERDLAEVNVIFKNFLQMKRNTYHRFFFLADQELITILENTKDAKTLANYAGLCFNCDRILLDKELVSGFESSNEIFKLRKAIIRGQPDEMFKSVEENMKNSLKFAIIALLPKMKIGMNIEQEHRDNSLQVILTTDKILFTEMTELYLTHNTYESYQLVLRRPCEQLVKYIRKTDISLNQLHNFSARLVQNMVIREIGEEMIKQQTSREDFRWKQQLKYSIEDEEIYVTQLNRKFNYGFEYYPPGRIMIPTKNWKMFLSAAHQCSVIGNKMFMVKGVEGEGKRNLMKACAGEFGCYYQELVCNKSISVQYIMRFVQGAIAANCWLSFYEFQHLEEEVLVKLLNQIANLVKSIKNQQEAKSAVLNGFDPSVLPSSLTTTLTNPTTPLTNPTSLLTNPTVNVPPNNTTTTNTNNTLPKIIKISNRVMFNFITHGFNPEKVSIYSFDTFCIAQPNYKKICEWLLQVNSFENWQKLSTRLIAFLETVFPFLQRVMGSFMSILRKIIDRACIRRYQIKQPNQIITVNNEFTIFANVFKEEIIDKSDENIHEILYEAVHAYFGTSEAIMIQGKKGAITQGEITKGEITKGEITQEKQQSKKQGAIKQQSLKQQSPKEHNTKDNTLKNNTLNNSVVNNKIKVLCSLLSQNAKNNNILVIGPRTNKSTIIQQCCHKLNRPLLNLYPQASQYFFQDEVVENLNKLSPETIIKYDGESVLREWNDLVISGYLLIEGQKIHLNNTVVLELREVINCSPSFVGSCQIVYIGNSMTKKEKFYFRSNAWDCEAVKEPMQQIFGSQLESLPDHMVEIFGELMKPYVKNPQSKNYHKLIAWYGTVLGVDNLWNRYYGGRHTDVTVNKYSQELVPIDQSKYIPVHEGEDLLLVHTKSTILYHELFKSTMQLSMPILMCGNYNCGKSTVLKLLLKNIVSSVSVSGGSNNSGSGNNSNSNNTNNNNNNNTTTTNNTTTKINLPIKSSTQNWSSKFKNSLTKIRKNGKNYLVNIGQNDIVVTIDDLDLGKQHHREYLRQVIDLKSIRDSKFQQHQLENVKIISSWHTSQQQQSHMKLLHSSKLLDRMIEVQFQNINKESITTILTTNLETFIRKHNMNKDVLGIVHSHIIKCLCIAFDDVTNVSGQGTAASMVLAVLRNLLSLPKKNYFIAADDYLEYFRMCLQARMMEKCFTTKAIWQYNSVYDNLNRVIFGVKSAPHQQQMEGSGRSGRERNISNVEFLICLEKKYKLQSISKIKEIIQSNFPHVHLFEEMLQIIIKLNNQLQSIDHHCVLVGRAGTGKRTILNIAAHLNKVMVCDVENVSEGLFQAYRGTEAVLVENYMRRKVYNDLIANNEGTVYHQIVSLHSDEEIEQKYMKNAEILKKYRDLKAGSNAQGHSTEGHGTEGQASAQKKLLMRIHQKIRNVLILDNLYKYKQIISQFRDISGYFVCYIDEWPVEALLTISGANLVEVEGEENVTQVNVNKLLAQIYTTSNRIMQSHEQPSISIKKFQQFTQIYTQMHDNRLRALTEKVEFYTKIYSKFNEACVNIDQWEKRVDILKAQLEEVITKLDNELSKNRQESMTFFVLYSMVREEDKVTVEKNNEMEGVKKQMEGKLRKMKTVMADIEKIIGSIQRTEMSELKKIYKNNSLACFGLECLCIMLKEEPSQKSINRILADSNLMMKMRSKALLQERMPKIEQKFKMEHKALEENMEKKNSSDTSRIIFEWVKSIIAYWQISDEQKQLNISYKIHKESYEQSLKKQRKLEEEIQQLQQKTIEINSQYESMFIEKEKKLNEYNSISSKIKNAQNILPALRKSEEQTWLIIKDLRSDLACLKGNVILAVVCLVYLPLKRLKLKKEVLDGVKRVLNNSMIVFSNSDQDNFMSMICGVKDAVMEDLNIKALRQLQEYIGLIVDPERRAVHYIFEHDIEIANIILQEKDIKEQAIQQKEQQQQQQQELQQQSIVIPKMKRKQKIFHITEEAELKVILDRLPQNTIVIDWKYTSLNTNEKIFLKIASQKKPEYFEAKKELNKKIKKNIVKILQYKKAIYEKICEKDIKILEDEEFVDIGVRLMELEVETENNRELEVIKIKEINELAQEINEEVSKIICIVNAMKKVKNVALDMILDIACSQGNSIENIVKWGICTLSPKKRLGWLLAIALDCAKETNEDLLSIITKDSPLKITEVVRNKKPGALSNKNYENLCRISVYSLKLKAFSESALKSARQFQTWLIDSSIDTIPQSFKPENLSILEQLTIIKIFKPRILLKQIKNRIKQALNLENIDPYTNKELLSKINPKFPILARCSLRHLRELCQKLNNQKLCIKNLIELKDSIEMKGFIWTEMNKGSWVVFHSIPSRNSREMLEDIVEYVMNYDLQKDFRVFIYVDQLETGEPTREDFLIENSKYIQNIGVTIFQQPEKLDKNIAKISESLSHISISSTSTAYRAYQKKLQTLAAIAETASKIKYPQLYLYETVSKVIKLIEYIKQYKIPLEFNIGSIAEYISTLYCTPLNVIYQMDIIQLICRIIDENKIHDKSIFGVPTEVPTDANNKIKNNYQILGCDESYFYRKNEQETEDALEVLALIKYHARSVKEEIPQIRAALARIPTNVLVYSREYKTKIYLHSYMHEMHRHNSNIMAVKQLMQWVNISSNQDFKDSEQQNKNSEQQKKQQNKKQQNKTNKEENAIDAFTWGNLMEKVNKLLGYKVPKNKLRVSLHKWLNNLKRKHEFMLYWNLDSPVFVLHPVLFDNFKMLVSAYVIHYLDVNFRRIKQQSDSINDKILYTLQIEFSRQTDQKDMYVNEGIVLPDLLYHEFRYNFQFKMLDAGADWSGEEPAGLIMLKMKKFPSEPRVDDYEPPKIAIGVRASRNIDIVFSIQTYIDGHYPEWELRGPMLISE